MRRAKILDKHLGAYSLAAVTPDVVAAYRDTRTAEGKANNTVRLELAMLSHLYTTAIREWGLGLSYNPVANVRKPSPGTGRNRRLAGDEESRLFEILDRHSNPMPDWIARIALQTVMRKGEILSLRRNQVDLARRVVRLERNKNGDSRLVPLSHQSAAVFREALGHVMHEAVLSSLLFYGEPGKDGRRRPYAIDKIENRAITKLVGVVDKHAGIEVLARHVLGQAIGNMLDSAAGCRLIGHVDDRSVNIGNKHPTLAAPDSLGAEELVVLDVLERKDGTLALDRPLPDRTGGEYQDVAKALFGKIPVLGGGAPTNVGWVEERTGTMADARDIGLLCERRGHVR